MKYNDGIIDCQIKIIDAIDSLENSFGTYQAKKMNHHHSKLKEKISDGINYLDKVGSYENDGSLLTSAKKLFTYYHRISDEDYPIIIEILSMPDSLFSEVDQQRLFDKQTVINDMITQAHNDFLVQQKEFGKRHNLVFTQE